MQGGKSEKIRPNEQIFIKTRSNMPSAVNWNSKSAIKFEKKAIGKSEICKNQAQKTSKVKLTLRAGVRYIHTSISA